MDDDDDGGEDEDEDDGDGNGRWGMGDGIDSRKPSTTLTQLWRIARAAFSINEIPRIAKATHSIVISGPLPSGSAGGVLDSFQCDSSAYRWLWYPIPLLLLPLPAVAVAVVVVNHASNC
ncbi:hypothetical protein EMPG_17103 [Blastomyces silverae]|uniref:Uncharacterized protein n=1 Tax=Blastomyces silverae TaxID=2060906 RepID=A0A0H1B8M0_9EURO|nr:hypothetical protein EMPG_17103 [Blastomyces silverae]